ncbi:2-amino-4-hydroxy-6-hydroxymethyldihydropteridine diphosphokinase [bacterium]|nr:2-amino-4-hydroxy-6-hydroxymethyldihydropteridine diphosphokinase [bacterium]
MDAARHDASGAWVPVVLGLGGNLGDRRAHLRWGLYGLACHPGIRLNRVSRPWESGYVGPGGDQPAYLNLVCTGRTRLAPESLLAVAKALEASRGRRPGTHMLPRPLDIDILIHGDARRADPGLTLPHPRLAERGFVLGPLAEIAPETVLPDSGETARAAWARIQAEPQEGLRPWPEPIVSVRRDDGGEEDWRAALAVHCR